MIMLSCRTDKLVGKEVATNAHTTSRALAQYRGGDCRWPSPLHDLQMAG